MLSPDRWYVSTGPAGHARRPDLPFRPLPAPRAGADHVPAAADFAALYQWLHTDTKRKEAPLFTGDSRESTLRQVYALTESTHQWVFKKVQQDEIPVRGTDFPELFSLIAALRMHMDRHPRRYTEVDQDHAPPGSRFVAHHSMEDWSRALVAWTEYGKSRKASRNKYGFAITKSSRNPVQTTLRFWTSKAHEKAARSAPVQQDSRLRAVREITRLLPHLTLSPAAHMDVHAAMLDLQFRVACPPGCEPVAAPRIPGSILPPLPEVGLLPAHLDGVERVLVAARSPPRLPEPKRDVRPSLDPEGLRLLAAQLRGALPSAADDQFLSILDDPHRLVPSMVERFLARSDTALGMPAPAALLRVRIRALPLPAHLAVRYMVQTDDWRGALVRDHHPHEPWQHDNDRVAIRAMRLCAVDMNNVRLIRPRHGFAATYEVGRRLRDHPSDAHDLNTATDSGASFLFGCTNEMGRPLLPVGRAHFVRYLTAESPVFLQLVDAAIDTQASRMRPPHKLLVVVEDRWIQQ